MSSDKHEANRPKLNYKTSVTHILTALEKYKETRSNNFSIKDKLSPADKKEREAYISTLKIAVNGLSMALLDAEAEAEAVNEKLENVLKLIDQGLKQFPEGRLHTVLYQITLQVFNIEEKAIQEVELKNISFDDSTQKYLDGFKQFSSILSQQSSLQEMSVEATTAFNEVKEALITLTYELDTQFPYQPPSVEQFKQFEKKFHAILHHQDEILANNYQGWWGSVVNDLNSAKIDLNLAVDNAEGIVISKPHHSEQPNKDFQGKTLQLYIELLKLNLSKGMSSAEETAFKTVKKDLVKLTGQLISEFPNQPPTPEQFKQFQRKFNATLHHQDEILEKNINWPSLAVNLSLAITGLGLVVLAAQAIHSKVTTGKASLFEIPTEKQEKFAAIKKSVQEVKNTTSEDPEGNVPPKLGSN